MKKTILLSFMLLAAICVKSQQTDDRWSVGFAAGWNGVAYQNGKRPNMTLEGRYLLPHGIQVGAQGTYFHKPMPSNNTYNAFSLSLRGSLHIKSMLGTPDPRWDFYAGTGVGYHWFRHTALEKSVNQFFVPVFVGTEWRFAPHWHLSLELSYNDASMFRLGVSRSF